MDFAIVFQISVYQGDFIFWVNLSLTNALLVCAAKALDRLLLVLALVHFFFSCGLGRSVPFLIGLRLCWADFVFS